MNVASPVPEARSLAISKMPSLLWSYLKVLGGDTKEIIDAIGSIVEDSPRTRVAIGPRSFYFLTEPDDIRHTLITDSNKCPISKAKQATTSYHPGIKIGNISQKSEVWAQHRRDLSRFVNRRGLRHNFDMALAAVTEHIQGWEGRADINVKDEAEVLTLKYNWSAFFGTPLSHEDAVQLSHSSRTLNEYMTTSMALMGRFPISVLTRYSGVDEFVRVIDEKLNEIIDARCQLPQEERSADFLTLVIDRNNLDSDPSPENRLQALSELAEILTASSINSSMTLYYAMHHLSDDPRFQQRIRSSNDNFDGSVCPHIVNKDMNEDVTTSIVSETLRLYPPAHLLVRKTTDDVTFDENFTIPKNNYILIPSWFVHRDARWYPDPNNFNPDVNFSPAANNNRPNMSFLSFAGGKHGCPGQGAALQQVSTILSLIYNDFSTSSKTDSIPEIRAGAVLDPDPDSRLIITPHV